MSSQAEDEEKLKIEAVPVSADSETENLSTESNVAMPLSDELGTDQELKVDENNADGETYIIAFHQVLSEPENFDVLIGGRYFDGYQKRDGIWKFSSRAVDADWVYVSDPSKVNLDHPMIKGAHIGVPGNKDPLFKILKSAVWGKD